MITRYFFTQYNCDTAGLTVDSILENVIGATVIQTSSGITVRTFNSDMDTIFNAWKPIAETDSNIEDSLDYSKNLALDTVTSNKINFRTALIAANTINTSLPTCCVINTNTMAWCAPTGW